MAHEGKKIGQARYLRKKMTASELRLWKILRGRRLLGLQFQRQQPVGPYIADFYCSAARIVVEVDGEGHSWQIKRDTERDRYMSEIGITVLRFRNSAVQVAPETVIQQIKKACEGHTALR